MKNKKEKTTEKKGLFDIIESYYLAHLLIHLNSKGIFNDISKQCSVNSYFQNRDFFEMLALKTDMVIRSGKKSFSVAPKYLPYINGGFHIEKFLEGYGHVVPGKKGLQIKTNDKKFAMAYQQASAFQNHNLILNLLDALDARHILDMGSGMAGLPLNFCALNKLNTAVCIEKNVHMCSLAKKNVQSKKLSRQVKIINEDVTKFDVKVDPAVLKKTDVVIGSSILNEFFYKLPQLIKFLKKIRRSFPGKFLIVIDYYGILHTPAATEKSLQHNYIHDMMQVLTGQGVPPKNKYGWNSYYTKANCKLIHAYEHCSNGINWFIHVVYLGKNRKTVRIQ